MPGPTWSIDRHPRRCRGRGEQLRELPRGACRSHRFRPSSRSLPSKDPRRAARRSRFTGTDWCRTCRRSPSTASPSAASSTRRAVRSRRTPPRTFPGRAMIGVSNGAAASAGLAFTFIPPPILKLIDPADAPADTAMVTIAVSGNNFRPETEFFWIQNGSRPTRSRTPRREMCSRSLPTSSCSARPARRWCWCPRQRTAVRIQGPSPSRRTTRSRATPCSSTRSRSTPPHEAALQADLLSLGVSAMPLAIAGLLVAAHRPGRAARRASRKTSSRSRKQVAGYVGASVGNLLVDPARRRAASSTSRARARTAPSPQGAAQVPAARLSPERRLLRRRDVRRARHAGGQPAYLENPGTYDSFRDHEPMRPTDVEAVGLMAPLGEALNRGQGMGPVFLGGPRRVPHVGAGGRVRSQAGRRQARPGGRGLAQAPRRLRRLAGRRPTPTSSWSTRARASSPPARAGGVSHLEVQRFRGRARGRAAARPIGGRVRRRRPAASSAPTRRSRRGDSASSSTRPSTPRCCR